MSSSVRSARIDWNSRRHAGFVRDTWRLAGPVGHTLSSQIQSNPAAARRSSSSSGTSASVAGRPSFRDSAVSQTRVLSW
jgi:hypothetical protein